MKRLLADFSRSVYDAYTVLHGFSHAEPHAMEHRSPCHTQSSYPFIVSSATVQVEAALCGVQQHYRISALKFQSHGHNRFPEYSATVALAYLICVRTRGNTVPAAQRSEDFEHGGSKGLTRGSRCRWRQLSGLPSDCFRQRSALVRDVIQQLQRSAPQICRNLVWELF